MIEQIEKSKKLDVYIHRDSGGDIDRVTIIGKFGNVQYWYPMGQKHIESIDVMTCEKCYRQLGIDDGSVNVKFIEEE